MEYIEEKSDPQTMSRSFAFVNAVKSNDSALGLLIGVSRPALLFDQGLIFRNDIVSRLTIRDVKTSRRLYHMDKNNNGQADEATKAPYKQDYGLFVGDGEWQVVLAFQEKKNAAVLGYVPYII